MIKLMIISLIAYLAGSLNFAIIFFKLTGKADPRLSFSGNAGTTNVKRQAGFLWAVVIFLLDIGRAVAVAMLAVYWAPPSFISWTGFFLVLGNSYPCFHGFRGGKGVASYLGFSLFIAPWWAFYSAVAWLAVFGICRLPFIASFFMVFVLAAGQAVSFHLQAAAATGSLATFILIVFNHRKNIREKLNKRANETT